MLKGDIPDKRECVLRDFERTINQTLPAAYRQFLLSTGGDTPLGNSFVVDEGDETWETEVSFFGLQTGAYCLYSVPENFIEYKGRIPTHLIPIGNDPGGNLICISIADETRGQVFFADHEYFSYDGEPNNDNAKFLAESITDFLDSLRDCLRN
ncbi:SMI1/KNR4 family protein [Rugamonas aquatica]|uniref:Knr4/Smi1-like domain-containing protein n=1 Tax=Rugamonas aquatica TaxID=2743357 RepID=A0A6A7N5P2_9BURK|nr:SMI1/KNR4 family protein [Rugamonas aquatica]MQA40356.1 hypothetical protein [Rugamonas aquatica]